MQGEIVFGMFPGCDFDDDFRFGSLAEPTHTKSILRNLIPSVSIGDAVLATSTV